MAVIEERVVEMRFDNAQFQNGTKESMKAIDDLEKKVQSADSAKGLQVLGTAAEAVSVKFNAMSVVAITALQRITNSAIDTGERMVKSLSTDQIAAGWDKYADKTAAVQTIMAATSKNFTDTGKQMEYVNEQLDKLNWFTDETSYNFLDMVSNIGKFTSNNIDLETSVTAMEGIANWAALSGANVNEASRAMYNLSQAIAVGSVKLIDWKSIENANMATAQFKETAIETAVAMGTLTKKSDGTFETFKHNTVSVSNFNEALSDAWFTSEVLLETLGKFGGFTDALYEAMDGMAEGITTSRLLELVDRFKSGTIDMESAAIETGLSVDELTAKLQTLSATGFELGIKSFRAAQEAKTFGEAIDSVKDAVSTGWMTTFEIIFGNYLEAKELWTALANQLYDIFAEGGNARNDMLRAWKELGGRDDLLKGVTESFQTLASVVAPLQEAFRDIFPRTTAEQLYSITKAFAELTDGLRLSSERADQYKRTFRGLFAVLDTLRILTVQFLGVVLGPLFKVIGIGADKFFALTANIGDAAVAFRNFVKEYNLMQAGAILVGKGIERLIILFQNLTNIPVVRTFIDDVARALRSLYQSFQPFFTGINASIDRFILKILEMDEISFSGLISAFVQLVKDIASNLGSIELNFGGLVTFIENGFDKLRTGLLALAKFVTEMSKSLGFDNLFGLAYAGVVVLAVLAIRKAFNALSEVLEKFTGIASGVSSIFKNTAGVLRSFQKQLNAQAFFTFSKAIAVLTASLIALSFVDFNKLYPSAITLGVFVAAVAGLATLMSNISFGKMTINFVGLSSAIAIFSAALLILVGAFSNLQKVNLDGALERVVLMGVLAAEMGAAAVLISRFAPKLSTGSIFLISFATAMRLLVSTIIDIRDVDISSAIASVALMSVLILAMSVLANACQKTVSTVKRMGIVRSTKSGVDGFGLLAMVTSLYILIGAVKKLGSLNPGEVEQGIVALIPVMTMFGALVVATRFAGEHANKAGIAILEISAAMIVISTAIKSFAKLEGGEIVKASQVLEKVGLIFVAIIAVTRFTGENAGKAGTALLSMAAAIALLVVPIMVLAKVDENGLKKAMKVIEHLSVVFALVVASTKFAGDSKSTIIAMAGSITLLAGVIAVMSLMDPEAVQGAALAIDSLILSFAALTAASKYMGGSKVTLITMTACVAILGVVIAEICKYNVDSAVKAAAGIAILLDSMAVAMLLLSKMSTDISPGVIKGAAILGAAFDVLVVIVGAMVGLAGLLANQEGVLDTFENGIQLFSMIGEAIGKFFGSIIGGFGEGVIETLSNALPAIGQNLSLFMAEMDGFFDGASKIDGDMVDAVGRLATMFLMLTAANVLDGLTRFLTGGNSLSKFGKELAAFGPDFKVFCNELSSISNTDTIGAAVDVANTVAAFARAVPNSGGALGVLLGDNTLDKFGAELAAFGPNFVSFCQEIQNGGIDKDTVITATEAANAVAAFASNVPRSGPSMMASLFGDNTLSRFGQELLLFAPGFVGFCKAIELAKIDTDTVNKCINTAKSITALADSIPNSGGILANWFGDNNIAKFGQDLGSFGEDFAYYSKKMEDVKPDVVTSTTNAMSALITLAQQIPSTGGILKEWFGEGNIGIFGTQLVTFAEGVRQYSEIVSELQVSKMDTVIVSLTQLVKLIKSFAEIQDINLYSLISTMESLAKESVAMFVDTYYNSFDKARGAGKQMVAGLIMGVTDKIPAVQSSGKTIAKAWFEAFEEVAEIASPSKKAFRDGGYVAQGFVKGVVDGQFSVVDSAKTLASSFLSKFRAVLGIHSPAKETEADGKNVDEGLKKGVEDNSGIVENAGTSIGDKLKGALKKALGTENNQWSSVTFQDGLMSMLGLEKGAQSEEEGLSNTITEMAKSLTDTLNDGLKDTTNIGSTSMSNLASGIKSNKSPEEAAKEKVENIRKIFEASLSQFSLNMTTADLEYSLWKTVNEKTATASQTAAAELANTAQNMKNQAQILDLSRQEYEKIVAEFGEKSTQAQESYNRYLEQQIKYSELSVKLKENQTALQQTDMMTLNEQIQKQKQAQQSYDSFMKTQAGMLLKQGFTIKEVQSYAQKLSGYDPAKMLELNKSTLNTAVTNSAKAVEESWVNAATTSKEVITETYANNGIDAAVAMGEGLQNGSVYPLQSTQSISVENAAVLEAQKPVWNSGGEAMAKSLADGLLSGQSVVSAASTAVMDKAYNDAMARLGLGGSNYAAIAQGNAMQAGKQMADNFANGYLSEDYAIYDATGEISENMLREALSYAEMIQNTVASKLDGYEPVITPVINMDDVQGTLDAIDAMISHATTASASLGSADRISQDITSRGYLGVNHREDNDDDGGGMTFNYTQNIYSPDPVDADEIYRESNNAYSDFKDSISTDSGGRVSQDIGGRASWD